MSAATLLDGLLDPLSRCLDAESARRLIELRVDPSVEQRIETLAERANEGLLSAEENAEYEALINAADFISILKIKARRHLLVRRRMRDNPERCVRRRAPEPLRILPAPSRKTA